MPAEAIEKFEQALQLGAGNTRAKSTKGRHHSWTASDSPVYNPRQAERAFVANC